MEKITIENLCKTFSNSSKPAIENMTVNLETGKLIGLVGPDGAGKTTLLRLLAGLLTPSKGSINVLGLDPIKQESLLRKTIGYMPQKFGLYEDLTVMQNLKLYADLKGVDKKELDHTFKELLHFTNLDPFKNRLAKNLSGGMKQKLGIACVLLKKPKILLLDEPSVGVDPLSRRELWKIVTNLVEEKLTVIWSTCYLDEAEQCNDVILLNEGKLLFAGEPKKFTEKFHDRAYLIIPKENEKRELLSKLASHPSILDCTVQGSNIRIVLKQGCNLPEMLDINKVISTTAKFEDAFIHTLSDKMKVFDIAISASSDQKHDQTNVIEARDLVKKFDHFTAVDNIKFSVKKGEIFGLLGPNGAGKSTTFKMLCGLLKPTTGSSSVMGVSLQKAASEARSKIGYMAQKFSLYGDLTCEQNLNFFAGIYPVPINEAKEVINKMIDVFDLSNYLSSQAKNLPLGFKQRLALACSLMHRPQILFLDEPTSGVDPITRREFWMHINNLVKTGMTVMVTTHFMDEAENCDRIGLINQGKLIMIGTPEELKKAASSDKHPSPTLEEAFIYLSLLGDEK